jgi:hypothetical protein
MPNNMKRFTPLILFIGDLLALFIFVFIGQSDHATLDALHPILGALILTADFALPWLIAGLFLGAFQTDPQDVRPIPFFARTLNAWLVAGPIAILLRALILGLAIIPTPFYVVAMTLGGLFVFAWRVLFVVAERVALRPLASRS